MKIDGVPTLPIAEIASRVAAGEALLEAGRKNPEVWLLTSDVMHSTGIEPFVKEFPGRFLNVGVAEQTMVGVAAGLATCGKIPFAATFAFLASMRACEQVRSDIAYPNLNVNLYATHSGVVLGQGGTTHHATEDIAIMRAFPNMTILAPADVFAARWAVEAAVEHNGPVYLRLRRGNDPIVYQNGGSFRLGSANLVRDGSDATLISYGRCLAECVIAAYILESRDIHARVVDMHTLKPLDSAEVVRSAQKTSLILTVEDHNVIGGLGSAVAEVLAEAGMSTRLKRLGFADVYAGIGPEEGLFMKHGLTGPQIAGQVIEELG